MGMRYQAAQLDADQLDAIRQDPAPTRVIQLLDTGLDLDKMWHAAQTLIAGSLEASEPLLSGDPIGDDLGYGPAMLADPVEVARIAHELAAIDEAELQDRFDLAELDAQGIYPSIWDPDEETELRAEVTDAAHRLLELYRHAASANAAIVAAIT